jgi:hypothetical protein
MVMKLNLRRLQVGDPRDERSLPGTPVLFHVDVITSGATKVTPAARARACVCARTSDKTHPRRRRCCV